MDRSENNIASTSNSPQLPVPGVDISVDERAPLLSDSDPTKNGATGKKARKPFYRARPLWLAPFALVASVVRGMTLAPRVEVFTQLSCHRVYGFHQGHSPAPAVLPQLIGNTLESSSVFQTPNPISALGFPSQTPESPPFIRLSIVDGGDIFDSGGDDEDTIDPNDSTSDPRNIPSRRCVEDPNVQAGAARLQMIMTTTMGLLSALSTGWWGHFGERFGRTRVLAISTLGLFLTDLTFILVSTPTSPLSKHGHKLLLIAPVIEGALGGWSTLQATTSAYISDCTSSGSRAHIFSRFTGVTFLGIFFGPSISGYLISRSGASGSGGVGGTKNVTSVFWVAVCCSFMNFLASVFIFPESLSKEKREKAREEYIGKKKGKGPARDGRGEEEGRGRMGFLGRLFEPLAVFLPVKVRDSGRLGRYRRDWSLTVLAVSFFSFMLCVGLYQLKYLYAEHIYGWGAEQLSWYISFLGGMRAISLLLVLPYVIGIFKPKVIDSVSSTKGKGKTKSKVSATATPSVLEDGGKPKPTRSQLGREIAFDLRLTRCSFLMDIVANLLIIASPAPTFHHTSIGMQMIEVMGRKDRQTQQGTSFAQSQALFVLASGMASLGTGASPAIHSLTLCILQAREMCHSNEGSGDQEMAGGEISAETERTMAKGGNGSVGGLFGAFAFLQSIGSMILGPMMFGMIYSNTVAFVPKAIFMVAAGTVCVSFVLMMLVRNPVREDECGSKGMTAKKKGKKKRGEAERGRSRVSKDLRGGAAGYEGE